MNFDFTAQMTSSHHLPMSMNKKLEYKDRQIYSKINKKGVQFQF